MEALTTIVTMVRNCGHIRVPDYQRAYSWDTDFKDGNKQVNVFLADLEDYLCSSNKQVPYYLGHFLFEDLGKGEYAVIDGQQRLTTIIIFVSAALERIKLERNKLTEKEIIIGEDLIKRRSTYRFSTVDYDNQFFRDYVIDRLKTDHNGIETTSAGRIAAAYDFFGKKLSSMDMEHVKQLMWVVVNASCTTHVVTSEVEAVQMFLFQNNRGKRPSRLEVIKAQFMYAIHVFGGEQTETMLQEVKSRFETIYRSISRIENFVDEDAVLSHTIRVYYNSLSADSSKDFLNLLNKPGCLEFIHDFTLSLERSFNNLVTLNDDSRKDVDIEAALVCGHYDIAIPFFIKAYSNGVEWNDLKRLALALGNILLRHNIIGTHAYLSSRLNDVFQCFASQDVSKIVDRINWMKQTTDWWWAYWNDAELERIASGYWGSSSHNAAKVLLWRYENYLIGKGEGYRPKPFGSIENPHLEHIAPQTENDSPAAGYDEYDEEFKEKFLYSIGNFLLLSRGHNIPIGNKPFEDKRATYTCLLQQREIQDMTVSDHVWNRDRIAQRKKILLKFMLENI